MIYIYTYLSLIILPLTCTHDSHSSPSKSRFVVGRGIDGIDCSIDASGRAGAPKANVSRCSVDFSGIQKGWFSNKNGGFIMGIYTRLMWIWPDGIYIYIRISCETLGFTIHLMGILMGIQRTMWCPMVCMNTSLLRKSTGWLTSGNQAWLAGKSSIYSWFSQLETFIDTGFSSYLCLITRGYRMPPILWWM